MVDTMHLGVLFTLSKISFCLCEYVICFIIFRSNKINCLYDLRASKVLGSWSFSSDATVQTNHNRMVTFVKRNIKLLNNQVKSQIVHISFANDSDKL